MEAMQQVRVVHSAVAGSLGTEGGAAVGSALTGENAVLPYALQTAILAIHKADLTAAYADITSGHVAVGANVTIQSSHEALAETHDFSVRLTTGVKVGTTLAAADGQTGQAVLEDLLKA